jgi:hypothetical protein
MRYTAAAPTSELVAVARMFISQDVGYVPVPMNAAATSATKVYGGGSERCSMYTCVQLEDTQGDVSTKAEVAKAEHRRVPAGV